MKYYEITYKYSESIYCNNIAKADTMQAVRCHYSKYEILTISEIERERVEYALKDAQRRGKPVIDCTESQPTESTENATEGTEAAQATETATETAEPAETTADSAETTAEPKEGETMKENYRIEENPEKNGIEIYFDDKPEETTRAALKAAGFRWHKVKKCWYGRADRAQVAEMLTGTGCAQTTAKAAKNATSAPSAKINLEGLEHMKKEDYGAEFAAVIRNELKRRGAKGVTVRSDRSGYTDSITVTITLSASDFRSVEACRNWLPANHLTSELLRSSWGVYTGGNSSLTYEDYKNMTPEEQDAAEQDYIKYTYYNRLWGLPERGAFVNDYEMPQLTADAAERIRAIVKIANAWNWDHSDSMTDYFDIGYYLDINYKKPKDFEPAEEITAAEREELAAERLRRKEAAEAAAIEAERREAERIAAQKAAEEKEARDRQTIAEDVEIIDLEEEQQYFIKNLAQGCGKECNLEEAKESAAMHERNHNPRTDAKISRKIIFCNPEALEAFNNMFLDDFDFLHGFGGTATDDPRVNSENLYKLNNEQRAAVYFYNCNCVAVYLGDVLQYVIDPQGYNYARYIYIPTDDTTEEPNHDTAPAEIEPFYFPAPLAEQLEGITPGEVITIYHSYGVCLNMIGTKTGVFEGLREGFSDKYISLKVGRKSQTVRASGYDEILIYKGLPESLPVSVKYEEHTERGGMLCTMEKPNREQLKGILSHYKTRGRLPIVDTVQR